ncbi:MAG: type II secretion system F family protein [Phycisphaeraceae bacterium]
MTALNRLLTMAALAVLWIAAGGLLLVGLTIATSVLGIALGPIFLYGGPVGSLMLLLVLAFTARRMRQRRATVIVAQLEQAVRLNLPLPPMLAAAASGESWLARTRLLRLRTEIEQGTPVGEAVAVATPELSSRAVSLIAAAEEVGQLPAALARLVSEQRRSRRAESGNGAFTSAYSIFMLVSLTLMLGLISAFILPNFVEIFEDFDVRLPWMTQWMIDWLPIIGVLLLPLSALLGLTAAGRATWSMFSTPSHVPPPWTPVTDVVVWMTPGAHALVRDRGLADAFHLAADALRAGVPLHEALAQASALRVNGVLRRRLHRVACEVEAGRELGDAARQAGLPALVVGMLGAAHGELVRTFDFLARYYQHRFSRLAELARATAVPVVVLAAALAVGWVVLAMFLPLVALIDGTTVDALNPSASWSR